MKNKAVSRIPYTWNCVVNGGADSWNNCPYRIKNGSKKIVNTWGFLWKIVYRGENNDCCGIDCNCYRCEKPRDCIPDICEKISNSLKNGTDAMPDSNKEVLNWYLDFIPWCFESTEKYICNIFHHIQYYRKCVYYEIPQFHKYFFNTCPVLLSIAWKQTNKNQIHQE